jgi:hypothetical protein
MAGSHMTLTTADKKAGCAGKQQQWDEGVSDAARQ